MREIIFRGKRTKSGEWVTGNLWHHTEKASLIWSNELDNKTWVLPETVGQFTGLTDKNGKKIFEGDIVVCRKPINGNWVDCCVEIGFVEMKQGAFGLHRKQGYYRPFKDWLEDYEYEVIGNIHDNRELMGV